MIRILLISLLLTACATDYRAAQARAVLKLSRQGYDLRWVDHQTTIISVDDRKWIPGRRYGWYDPETKDIIVLKNVNTHVLCHEYQHFLLHELRIDIGEHHKIINGR